MASPSRERVFAAGYSTAVLEYPTCVFDYFTAVGEFFLFAVGNHIAAVDYFTAVSEFFSFAVEYHAAAFERTRAASGYVIAGIDCNTQTGTFNPVDAICGRGLGNCNDLDDVIGDVQRQHVLPIHPAGHERLDFDSQ